MSILEGALIGAGIGLIVAVTSYSAKNQKYKKLLKSISIPYEYAGFYHYASAKRYLKGFKFFDSFGVLFLSGNTAWYKSDTKGEPISFDLSSCQVQQEPDWRWLKWFSITTSSGLKHYFNSNKMGLFKNDSTETLKGLAALRAKSQQQ